MKKRISLILFGLIVLCGTARADDVPLGTTIVPPDVITYNASTGVLTNADSTPTCNVYRGTNDTAVAAVSGNMTLRSGTTGHYRFSFAATTGNGFAINDFVNVVCIATVGGLQQKKQDYHFRIAATENTAGYIVVTIKDGTGTGEIDTTSGGVLVNAFTTAGSNAVRDSVVDDATKFHGARIDAAISSRGTFTVKQATSFEWPMLFAVAGTPVTSTTPSCKISKDTPISTGSSAPTNAASSTTNLGYSELTLSSTDMTATHYVSLYCTAGAAVYQSTFKIEAP